MVETTAVKTLMEKTFKKRREKGVLSEPHDEMHAINVARYGRIFAERIAKKEGFNEESIKHIAHLTEAAGYLHDIVRLRMEEIPHEVESARWVAYASNYLREPSLLWVVLPETTLELSKKELAIITFAIIQHEKHFTDILKITNFGFNTDEKALVTVSLKVADSLFERSGFRMIERMCFFIGSERLHKGDLQYLKETELTKEKPYLWAVLGETMLRLYSNNPIKSYPQWLKDTAVKLRAIQYRFYANLVKLVAPTVPSDELVVAHLLTRIKFPGFNEKLLETIKKERHLTKKHEGTYSQIQDAIRAAAMDNQKILLNIMSKISSTTSITDAYKIWKKATHTSYFAHGIIEYNEGGCDYVDAAADNYKRFE